ncbi:uncharacterized protein FOMMEDRAFT_31538 [Fomitiporia mediterranea MF3/22]|uniref:uncharacterized protein n=1 Tax=Fomitiporia mediterranea (strain MF3/22) TaxID=694068 RepID=UPI0004408979|nr:uncharacterized protein FOMMEDRAFT_31538 [Fomitiporia mediterranea MF3/22]EJC98981.1 hypothetical protein FOMMEDRAFT_31538 [Fomitiporia mediterranea MF3/22]
MNLSIRSDSDIVPIDPSEVPFAVMAINTDQYFQVAVVATLAYDAVIYFSTMGNKNRYTGLLGPVALVLYLIVVISVDYVLMIRVIALYAQDTTLSTVLKVLLCVEAVLKLVATIYIGKSDEIGVANLANALVCYEGGVPGIKWAFLDWVVPMVFELILMVLAVYKAAQYWKDAAGLEGVPLVKILIRDQVIYFAL